MRRTLLILLALCMIASNAVAQPGSNDPTFNTFDDGTYGGGTGFDNYVSSIAIQPDGKIIVGGTFSNFNGTARNYIARLNADGTMDTGFDPGSGFNNWVHSVSLQTDGKIIVGGSFTSFNGTARNRIARLNTDGTLDTGFDPGTGFNGAVQTTAIQADGKIIVGGSFTSFNGTSRNRIARLNADGMLDTGFDPGTAFDNLVRTTIIQADGKIILGGGFTSFNGTARNFIARLNANGSLDTGFDPGTGFGYYVYSTAIQADGKIIVGGDFTSFNGTPRNSIARLNTDGSLDTGFDPGTGFNFMVRTTNIQADGKTIVGGFFITFNGIARNYIARLNTDGSLDTGFDPGTGFGYYVYSTAIQADGKIIVGGEFSNFNGTARKGIARLNSDGTLDAGFNTRSGFNAEVKSTAIQTDGKIIVVGEFSDFNGTTRNYIARLNADGALDTGFDTGTGFSYQPISISIQTDGKIIVGGSFDNFNGTARNKIARLNADGTLDSGFDPGTGFDAVVRTTVIQADGKIIVGGGFSSFNGTARNFIARLNTDGSLDTGFDPGTGFNNSVSSISIQADGKIIVGGSFTSFNGTARNSIARLNTDGTLDTGFDPGTGFNGTVLTTAIQADGKIIVGGGFSSFNGTARNKIARINADGTLDVGFDPGTGFSGFYVFSTTIQSDGKIIVGGNFTSFNGTARNKIARLNTDGTLDLGFDPGTGFNFVTGFSGPIVYSTAIQADGKIIVGGIFDQFNGVWRNCIARLLINCFPNTGTDIQTACDNYTWIDGLNYTTSNTSATHTLTNIAGCDSVVTLNLTINIGISADAPSNLSACDSYILPSLTTGDYFTATGGGGTMLNAGAIITNTQTLYVYATNGMCSDENIFVVTINTLLNTVSLAGNTLTANESGATYQWLDCDNANAPIVGATSQSYTVSASGNYAVEVTNSGCTSTSACTAVTFVTISESTTNSISIYPNPSTNTFTITTEQLGSAYRVTDNIGKVIAVGTINNTTTNIDLSNNPSGLYFVIIDGFVYKLVKL